MIPRTIKYVVAFLMAIGNCQPNLFCQSFVEDTISDPAHTLLWFHGHWNPSNKKQFIIDKDTSGARGAIGGGMVIITDKGEVQITTPQVDDWNKKMDDGLKDLEKFEEQLDAPSNVINEWGHHFNEAAKPEIEEVRQNWQSNKIDKKSDVLSTNSKENQQSGSLQDFVSKLDQVCQQMKPKYDAVIGFYQAHKKDKDADYNNPAPPETDNQCVACDTSKQKQYDKQSDDYVEKFFKPESDLLKDGLNILRQMVLLQRGTDIDGQPVAVSMDAQLQDKIENSFNKKQNGACSYFDDYQLHNAVSFLAKRQYWRAKKLFRDYRNNIKTAQPVIRTLLTAARANILMGTMSIDEAGDLSECGELIRKVEDYYTNKLFHEHDWSQLANIPFILGLEREHQLVGGAESDLLGQLSKLLNGFRLQIEMDVKLGKSQKYILAHLKGEAKIAPEFDFNNDTCYRWVVVDGTNNLGLPLKKGNQQIECDLLANEIVVQGPGPVYIGAKKYFAMMYGLKMDYCHPGKDSIFLSSFIAVPNALAGKWQIPQSRPQPLQINGTDGVFRNINKMEEVAKSGKAQQQAEIMKEQGEKIIAQMKAVQNQMGNGKPNMASYQKMQDLATQAMSLGTNENIAPLLYIDFPLQIQNNNTTLQEKRFDAKEINPREAEAIVYGYYTVKVIYKP